jgi:hypothetical protein
MESAFHTHCQNRLQPDASLLKALILHLNLVEYPVYRSVLGCSIIVITHANRAEIITREPYSSLLDELDRIVALRGTQASPYHWAHLVSGYQNLETSKDSFFSLAVQFGLVLYIQQKLQEASVAERSKQVEPLLGYAMHPLLGKLAISSHLISTLLQNGAKPNKRTALLKNMTPWERPWT